MKVDIIIVGAGLVGMTAACAMAKLGMNIIIIDAANLSKEHKKGVDGRTCAIAAGSAQFFDKIDVWHEMQGYAGQILDIRVTDGNSPMFLHYDHKLVGDHPMGYIIENYYIRKALLNRLEEYNNVTILSSMRYSDIEFTDDGSVIVNIDTSSAPVFKGKEISEITARMLIAADGRKSYTRRILGIGTHNIDYDQSGIVCTIKHTQHHQFIAQERFLPQGPFAVLPMSDGYHSSLVWTEKTKLANLYVEMDRKELAKQIIMRTGEYLGEISVASKVYKYPLSLCKARKYVSGNCVLIGDSAHAMHPLAGQGFNVGIRDVESLMKLFADRNVLQGNIDNILSIYEKERLSDSVALSSITDTLNRLFSNNLLPLKLVRRTGLGFVNVSTPLKRFLMKHAMGL